MTSRHHLVHKTNSPLSHPLFSDPQPSGGSLFGLRARPATRKSPCLTYGPTFFHSAPMELYAFGFRLPANAPEGQKRFLSVTQLVK